MASEYIINTAELKQPEKFDKLDTKNSSREKDGVTIKVPSRANPCAPQLWEVYAATTILCLQPHSSIVFKHVKALCEHTDTGFMCEGLLKEHLIIGTVLDDTQDVNMYTFLEEYFNRKFQVNFTKNTLQRYVLEALDDPRCGRNGISRVYLLGPHIQAMLLNSSFFEAQYDEIVRSLRTANMPCNDVMADGEDDIGIGVAAEIKWDNVQLYDDPTMILKKHGGWALSKNVTMVTPKDQLILRLTGTSLEQILVGKNIPDSPRIEDGVQQMMRKRRRSSVGSMDKDKAKLSSTMKLSSLHDEDGSSESSHVSDFDIDPEHKKVVPLGMTCSEMYLLLRGIFIGLNTTQKDLKGSVVGEHVSWGKQDGHALAAAVLTDLYMRDQIDVHHWTLNDGSTAVPYKIARKRGQPPMDHFLDDYVHDLETTFGTMRLPAHICEAPIWASLEERGIIDNHRPASRKVLGVIGYENLDVWDLARPDVLLDLQDAYVMAARVLYDKSLKNASDEKKTDMLMFVYIMQILFDQSSECADGLARVLTSLCPPFEKGELYPPSAMIHSGSVIHGLIERSFRFANNSELDLAQEAADFNESVMERLEENFFLSNNIMENLDADNSGAVTLDEFVEGFRNMDLYKDFRKERMPDEVLRMVIVDLAEKLFQEVDCNMDGSLTPAELQNAFQRRREDASKRREQRKWARQAANTVAVQIGIKSKTKLVDLERVQATNLRNVLRKDARIKERRRNQEWQAEVERPEFMDKFADVDTTVTSSCL